MRVALAGRVKAGKSTLLNALVGERLAPTDAGECTRIVTWYRFGESYEVHADLRDGRTVPVPFSREDGRLTLSWTEEDLVPVVRLVVSWPAARLRGLTLIDTPGLDSTRPGISQRTVGALTERDSDRAADAVIYLMRHVHMADVRFLEAFLDSEVADVTPVNSVAVLSRADEIGGGRRGAMESAAAIAARIAGDPRVRTLASAVVPVAGLYAETGATVMEREAEWMRMLARRDPAELEWMLRSVDRFREPGTGPLTVEIREELLERFGLPGIRDTTSAFVAGQWGSGPDLSRWLRAQSGIQALDELLRQRFGGRARQLVARSVLEGLAVTLGDPERQASPEVAAIARQVEATMASAHEIAELRMLDMVWGGAARFTDEERAEAERVSGEGTVAERCGCDAAAGNADLRAAILEGVVRWRERAADGLVDRLTAYCCETMAHSYEVLFAALQ